MCYTQNGWLIITFKRHHMWTLYSKGYIGKIVSAKCLNDALSLQESHPFWNKSEILTGKIELQSNKPV
jgi:hypothetical protein